MRSINGNFCPFCLCYRVKLINRIELFEPHRDKTCFTICEQQRRRSACVCLQSDQRLYFRCLDSVIPLVSISEISSLNLASLAAQAGLCLT